MADNLIFATTYVDSPQRATLLGYWIELAKRNENCDILLVDTPCKGYPFVPSLLNFTAHQLGMSLPKMRHTFADNIGHLAHGGQDGWGRALDYGLRAAVSAGYEYVAHIEGDVLFKPRLDAAFKAMLYFGDKMIAPPLTHTRPDEHKWIETSIMLFDVRWLERSGFLARYDWPARKQNTPEEVVWDLVSDVYKGAPWFGRRNDGRHMKFETLHDIPHWAAEQGCVDYPDWATHCQDARIYDRLMEEWRR